MGLSDAQAEENAQEAYSVAARKLDRIDDGRERAFLLGVAVRLAANVRRRAACRVEQLAFEREPYEIADGLPQAEELLEQKQQRAILDRILQSMSDPFREILTLYEIEELTMPEVAVALEIPEGTAASRLRRAREEFSRKIGRLTAGIARCEEES
jgi:RNA polymerase sigma-70 factor (ECF subfamily)